MTSSCFVLDACSIINLIHLDEEEFLLKKLSHLDIFITDCVFREVKSNVFKKLEAPRSSEDYKERGTIDQNLSLFRNYRVSDEVLLKDFGQDFFDKVKELTRYRKKNGEFFSAALALYKSREKPAKVFFYTDDYPAKEDFNEFFHFQQIGHIEDTADLLILLHTLDDNFSQGTLENLLSKLFSEYAADTSLLLKKLREYRIPRSLIRDRQFNANLHNIIGNLSRYDFAKLRSYFDFFFSHRKKYRSICEIIEEYKTIAELESESGNLLNKIKLTQQKLKEGLIFKI